MRFAPVSTLGVLLAASTAVVGAEFDLNGHTFMLPDGFVIELAAGEALAPHPVSASFDDQGRLYVTDSSGSNKPPAEQVKNPDHRVLRLEDTNADGRFDKAVVFADKVMFPQGCLWHDGGVYVAAPPSIWKFSDTDGDGVADKREEWFKGGTLTGCANDIHGPYLGPDGYLYWTKGAFAEQTHTLGNGRQLKDRAAHIYRARSDASDLDVIMSGGMDNPVEVAFTPEGEAIFTSTFIDFSQPGWRDGIGHAVYGGVFGKVNDVLDDGRVKRTDPELLHPFVELGPAVPSGLCRYQGAVFGPDFRDNFFATLFNLHKVTRHVLHLSGATYASTNHDFVVSDSLDFHPTDVLEDADGSLLIVDTGGWYKLCCPSSQLAKPEVPGAIYRVRTTRVDAIARMERDYRRLTAPPTLRLGNPEAFFDKTVWEPQTNPVNWLKEPLTSEMRRLATNGPAAHALRRIARNAGVVRHRESVPVLLAAATHTDDPFLTHSLVFALIGIADAEATRAGLRHGNARTHRAALIALDQMDGSDLNSAEVVPFLSASDEHLRAAAGWILGRHLDWGGELAGWFREQLGAGTADSARLEQLHAQLRILTRAPAGQQLLADLVTQPGVASKTRAAALDAMSAARLKETPRAWSTAVLSALGASSSESVCTAAVRTTGSLAWPKEGDAGITTAMLAIGRDPERPTALRLEALAAVPGGLSSLGDGEFDLLRVSLHPSQPVQRRRLATEVLTKAKLTPLQLANLTDAVTSAGPLDLPRLLPIFASGGDEALGRRLLASLKESKISNTLRADVLKPVLAKFPESIQRDADAWLASLQTDVAEQRARFEALLVELQKLGGDLRRGQALFNSQKAVCSSCHKIGYLGGELGPDLTSISQARSERDLLEAVIYPSASFVRSYEPYVVVTKDGEQHTGVLRRDAPDEIVLGIGPGADVRIARADIAEIRPGEVSTMPAGLDQQLSHQELADLLAFLKNTRWGAN